MPPFLSGETEGLIHEFETPISNERLDSGSKGMGFPLNPVSDHNASVVTVSPVGNLPVGAGASALGEDVDMRLDPDGEAFQALVDRANIDGTRQTSALGQMPQQANIARGIAFQIAQASVGQDHTIELVLDPIELGKVKITVYATDSGLNIQIFAERLETLELMRRNPDFLKDEFTAIGHGDVGFEFNQHSQGEKNLLLKLEPTEIDTEESRQGSQPTGRSMRTVLLHHDTGLDIRL